MSLESYFSKLIEKVESSDISNQGKDENGFFKPRRVIILRHLGLLRDLHLKPLANAMVRESWAYIVSELPPDWLILTESEKHQLKKILGK